MHQAPKSELSVQFERLKQEIASARLTRRSRTQALTQRSTKNEECINKLQHKLNEIRTKTKEAKDVLNKQKQNHKMDQINLLAYQNQKNRLLAQIREKSKEISSLNSISTLLELSIKEKKQNIGGENALENKIKSLKRQVKLMKQRESSALERFNQLVSGTNTLKDQREELEKEIQLHLKDKAESRKFKDFADNQQQHDTLTVAEQTRTVETFRENWESAQRKVFKREQELNDLEYAANAINQDVKKQLLLCFQLADFQTAPSTDEPSIDGPSVRRNISKIKLLQKRIQIKWKYVENMKKKLKQEVEAFEESPIFVVAKEEDIEFKSSPLDEVAVLHFIHNHQ